MLVHLSVHNYAIVEHLDLELDRGMSVITGKPAPASRSCSTRWA
jgi:DNA repair ATPase RecN